MNGTNDGFRATRARSLWYWLITGAAVTALLLPTNSFAQDATASGAPPPVVKTDTSPVLSKTQTTNSADTNTTVTAASASQKTDSSYDAIFDHSKLPDWLWISGQANLIYQYQPGFPAQYSGQNSLPNYSEHGFSQVFTLYTGVKLGPYTEILGDAESAGGTGIGNALGLAGYANLDVVRNPSLGRDPYMARLMVHQIIPLSDEMVDQDRGPMSLFSQVPVRRIEIRVGRFSMADFFDNNSVGGDSHHQFLNWTVDNNGAYDYAADTRGYTYGAMVEYDDRYWSARLAEALMPTIANGLDLDWNLGRAHSENLELEFRPNVFADRKTTIRVLGYANTANMGDYQDAINLYLAGKTSVPDVTATRRQGTVKYGTGLNVEQQLTQDLSGFVRLGWNEGAHESFAYTEVNNTFSFGATMAGRQWGRPQDKVGLAFVSNGLSAEHARYLQLGGNGFLLGDGGLKYGRENIVETFYNFELHRGVNFGPDFQFIQNPGYNQARGPVEVFGWRVHLEF